MSVRLTWTNNSSGHDGTYVYRDTATMDPQALPAPIADLPAGSEEFVDGSVRYGTFYYRVQDHESGSVSTVSSEVVKHLSSPDRDLVTIALVADNTTHSSAVNTKQALLDAGFVDGNISLVTDEQAPPASDVIVVCRACATQTETDNILSAFSGGTPVIWGTAPVTVGTGRSMGSTFADLTGTVTVADDNDGYNGDEVVHANHYISEPFGFGKEQWFSGANFGFSLDSGASFVGDLLANGDPDVVSLKENAALIAIEAGTSDLLGNPTPARSVVWTNLYGGQTSYTADGAELLGRLIDWCTE